MFAFVAITTLLGIIAYAVSLMGKRQTPEFIPQADAAPYVEEQPTTRDDEGNLPLIFLGDAESDGSVLADDATQLATTYPVIPATPKNEIDALFLKYGTLYNVPPNLLKALAVVESALKPNAIRNNPPNDVSAGLMQVLCLPGANGVCTNKFNVDGWQGMTLQRLLDPETNIKIGAQIIAYNLRTYGYKRGIAVYNSWSARNSPADGPFPNDAYVNKVLSLVNKL